MAEEPAALLNEARAAHSNGVWQTPGPTPTPGTGVDVQTEASLVGQRLGAYVVEVPLGQGGGGSVWRAWREDCRHDGAVAIKLLHLSLLGGAGVKRFEREGQILARLIHPHIAHLLDAGVTAGSQPYLVLELVEGARIDRHCDTQRLGIDARLALFDSVLAAVAHAHTHGVIREAGYDDGLIEVLCSQIDGDLMAGQRDKAQARLSEAQQMLARQRSPLPELEARCLVA